MKWTMESFSFYTLSLVLFLCLFYQSAHSQQLYIDNLQLDCQKNPSIAKGHLCNSPMQSCKSYVTFRTQPPYDTAISIAYLLGAEAISIASINNISNVYNIIPSHKLIMVPISCSCSENIYEHYSRYIVKQSDTEFLIANNTYQSLTTGTDGSELL